MAASSSSAPQMPQQQQLSEPQQIGIDVTGMSPEEIEKLETAPTLEGELRNGVIFPKEFSEKKEKLVIKVKPTKKNRELYEKYGAKAFTKDGDFNYTSWCDGDLIKEIIARKDKGKNKKRTIFLKRLGNNRLLKLLKAIPASKHKTETQTQLESSINKFIERGDPKAIAKLKRKQQKRKLEKQALKREKGEIKKKIDEDAVIE